MSEVLSELLVPFGYYYMLKAMWVSALVGGVCAFLSSYLMLKGWSLMGDALGHSIVPGVAAAYIIGGPMAVAYTGMWKIAEDIDELAVAGALAGHPLNVVRARTVDLLVPAEAEVVIEGYVDTEYLEP